MAKEYTAEYFKTNTLPNDYQDKIKLVKVGNHDQIIYTNLCNVLNNIISYEGVQTPILKMLTNLEELKLRNPIYKQCMKKECFNKLKNIEITVTESSDSSTLEFIEKILIYLTEPEIKLNVCDNKYNEYLIGWKKRNSKISIVINESKTIKKEMIQEFENNNIEIVNFRFLISNKNDLTEEWIRERREKVEIRTTRIYDSEDFNKIVKIMIQHVSSNIPLSNEEIRYNTRKDKTIDLTKMTELQSLFLTNCHCKKLIVPKQLKKIHVSKCVELETIEGLENVENLNIEHCRMLGDVSIPNTIKNIHINTCGVLNVKLSEEVKELDNLYLKNVPSFNGFIVPTVKGKLTMEKVGETELKIEGHYNQVKLINLYNTAKYIEGKEIEYLEIFNTEGTIDLSASNINGVEIEDCENLNKIVIPKNVKTVKIGNIKNCEIANLSESNVETLSVKELQTIPQNVKNLVVFKNGKIEIANNKIENLYVVGNKSRIQVSKSETLKTISTEVRINNEIDVSLLEL